MVFTGQLLRRLYSTLRLPLVFARYCTELMCYLDIVNLRPAARSERAVYPRHSIAD